MFEKVLDICEVEDVSFPIAQSCIVGMYPSEMLNYLLGTTWYDGYKMTTEMNSYYILISNEQNCCEIWGYISSDYDIQKYIGKTLVYFTLTDENCGTYDVKDFPDLFDCGETNAQFVDLVFSDGDKLQLAVYNSHNGYYGHDIVIFKENESEGRTVIFEGGL